MPHIEANGVNLFYDLRGPEAAPLVIFSNSVGATLEMWDPQVAELAGRFRCLRYDTRGHGRSAKTPGPTTIADLANDLAGLLDGLRLGKAHVVGLSLGGMTAQAFALRYPARLSSLTLLATSAYLNAGYGSRAAQVRQQGLAPILDAVMQRSFTPAFIAANPAKLGQVREKFLANDPEGYAQCCEAIEHMDLRESISAIQVPTLLLAGEHDPSTPVAMLEDIRTRITGAELVVVPDAAHLLNIEQAAIVNRHMSAFLSAQVQAGGKPGAGDRFEAGLANRKAVLGAAHVERSFQNAGPFAQPWQEFVTRTAWGDIWGDPALPWKTRSMLTLTMMVALHREEEFKLHLRPALQNGVSLEELRAMLLQAAVYAGVPAANAAFRWVREVLGDELAGI